MAKIQITEADKKVYREKGYWISPKLIDDARIERLRKAHDRVWAGDYDGDGHPMISAWHQGSDPLKIRKLDNGWWINDEVRAMVTDPLVGELAAALMETDEARLWHDQMILKPGTAGQATQSGNVGWHQDYGYWQSSDNPNMVTVWIALQDTVIENGAMTSIAGSHKWGLVPDSNTFFDQDLDALRKKYEASGREWNEEPCILRAGEASFHHALTFHGSGPNLTDQPRLSIVAHVMPRGTAYRPRIQYHSNVRLLGPRPYAGQPFAGEYFPVLWSANEAKLSATG